MAGMVDEHCTLVLAARLFGTVHEVVNVAGITEQEMIETSTHPADYHYERPVYDTLVADVEAIVRNALKELGRETFRK